MANIWMHNGFLQVESEKMSKSLGNFVTIHELLTKGNFGNRTWPGEVLRLAMLRTHYRQPIDWTVRELERADEFLREFYDLLHGDTSPESAVDPAVREALSDDLNTHVALARVHDLARMGDLSAVRASLNFLGFSCDKSKLAATILLGGRSTIAASGRAALSAETPESRQTADQNRSEPSRQLELDAEPTSFSVTMGDAIMIVRRGDGTYEAEAETQKVIDDLISRRNAARARRDFAEADKIRDEFAALGVAIKDNKDGTTTWEPKR
jgi:cysteinyl-tRNA synthetase